MRIALVMYNVLSTERMSLMLLSALAKKHFPYADVDLFVYTDNRLHEQLTRFKPDIVAFSTMTGEHTHYLKISGEVKEIGQTIGKRIFTVMGGPHCTFAPDVLRNSGLDAIGVGECDDAWPELLSALEAGRSINEIPNIVTQENFDRVVRPAALINDRYVKYRAISIRGRTCKDPSHFGCLDHLPFLDWELFLSRTDFDKFNSLRKRTIMSRRGCPFQCSYCFNRVFGALFEGGSMSVHNYSVDRVIEECRYVGQRWPAEFWKFYDDIGFFSSRGKEGRRLEEFAEKWPREIGLPFFFLLRADLVARDPDILHLLKKAGCISVSMSIEAGNDYIRNRVLERRMTNEEIIFAHHLAWDLGIKTFTNVILSIPVRDGEIKEHHLPPEMIARDIESVAIAVRAKVHFIECPILNPYPGTKLGEYCEENGFFDGNYNKLPQSYQNISPLDCFTLREKRMSQNLALLSMWCAYFASRKNVVVRKVISPVFFQLVARFFIRLPWRWCTKIYFLLYDILQQWLCASEIYRPKYRSPFKTLGKGFWGRLRYEYDKQFPKNR